MKTHSDKLNLRGCLVTLGCLCLLAAEASASPITWNLQDVTFNVNGVGTYMTGSFGYDFNTGKYSSVNLASTTTGPLTNAFVLTGSGGNMLQVVSGTGNLTGNLEMFLSFKKNLYAPLVTIAISLDGIGTCSNATCTSTTNTTGFGNGAGLGFVTTNSVPEPASLFLCGPLVLVWGRIRRGLFARS